MAQLGVCVLFVLCVLRVRASQHVEDGRLPGNLAPSHYNLQLQPNTYDSNKPPFDLHGQVAITFLCLEATSHIVLHSKDLKIEVVSLVDVSGRDVGISEVTLEEGNEFLTLSANSTLSSAEQYVLDVQFIGKVSEAYYGQGMYAQSYVEDGETRYLLWSDLAYFQARKVFPCFDEPEYKATFNVVLLRHPHVTALSNAHLLYTEQREGVWVADHFALTPLMSTYLLCFVVCDFPHVEASTSSGTLVRVWARQDVIEAADFALNTAVATQEWLEQYTKLPDPMHKMDHIAIPEKGGAMENWGLITYSENYLLWKENWRGTEAKLAVATIVSHELAHQWFGDRVTNAWWDDHWLNEGLASFFETMPMQDIHGVDSSKMEMMEHIFVQLGFDVSAGSNPVMMEVGAKVHRLSATRAQYSKGALILRMVQQVLSTRTFKQGILKYLTKFSYSSVVSDDLWDVLSEQAALDGITDPDGSPLDLKEKFDPWLQQRGFPLIHVSWDPVLKSINLTQHIYNPQEQHRPQSDYDYKWNIPLTMGDRSSSAVVREGVDIWMDRDDSVVDGSKFNGNWILVNIGARSLCRVKYDQKTFDGIVEQLIEHHEVIHPESRALLVDDVIDFASYGLMSFVDFLKISQYLGSEMEPMTWKRVRAAIDFPILVLRKFPDTWRLYQQYLRSLVDPIYETIGWHGATNQESLLRKLIIELACQLDNEDCLQSAWLWFQEWKTDPAALAVDQRYVVYCYGVRQGDEADWQLLYERELRLESSHMIQDIEERRVIQKALGCSSDTALLHRYLNKILDRADDVYSYVYGMASMPEGRLVIWEHLQETQETNNYLDPYTIKNVFRGLVTEADIQELEVFMNSAKLRKYEKEDFNETVSGSLIWVEDNLRPVHDWLLAKEL